ncbi:MAG: rhomboid family intramembrane serine protease [Gammaproteobacteria bacterium]|nr:rhomboid family intramembrane serine protease [Gammaproteobacteria bacterium]
MFDLANIVSDVQLVENTIFYYLDFTLGVLGFLFLLNVINNIMGGWLNILGIIPRNIFGLIGIICSPFLHGNFNHLFFNAIPLFFLMNMILIYGYKVFIIVTGIIVVISGSLTWLFGRYAIHLGASGVILGYFGFLVISAYLAPSFLTLMLLILTLYYFGGLVASLIPVKSDGISVEGHIFGFIAGIASFYLLPYFL